MACRGCATRLVGYQRRPCDTLDACEAKAEKAGSGLPQCYEAFGATGTLAKKRAECIRSNCAKECLGASP